MKKKIYAVMLSLCILALAGCSSAKAPEFEQFSPYISEVDTVTYPSQGIIALGEATHGNREFTELKLEVFQQLIAQHDVRAFAIEGDFGGCAKVNVYIQTGEGTAEEAAGEIGFAIYRTREMADILEWMRDFNTGRDAADQIRFYGYDMQRHDNNKDGLFEILSIAAPELLEKYDSLLSGIDDETMYDMDKEKVEQVLEGLDKLYTELENQKGAIVSAGSEEQYDLACQFAVCIRENTELRTANNYGTLRDGFMAEKVKWIYEYEAGYYDSQLIFIAGHNSHVGKTTATVGTQKCMGELLHDWYGSEYYVIGTEFNSSTFLAPDESSGGRREYTIQNSGDNRLAVLLMNAGMETLFFDAAGAADHSELASYLEEKQAMSAVGDSFAESFSSKEKLYTQKISVSETYDGIIFFDKMNPSTMLAE